MRRAMIILASLLILFLYGCGKQEQPSMSKEKARNYANELYNRQLFQQSADEYSRYLYNYKLDDREQVNISYHIADIYFERMKDYENALAFYVRAKYFNPQDDLKRTIDQKIVACLERLERPEDAQQSLKEAASLEPEIVDKKRPGAVVAVIGPRKITQGDIDFELSQLPPSIRNQYQQKSKKIEFLKQYILTELLFDSARRQGLDKDSEVVEAAFQAKKSIMVQKLLQQEISSKINIQPEDVELYYKANKDKYVEKNEAGEIVREKTLPEVQQQVAQDLAMERQRQYYEDLAQKLMRAEGVKIYEDVLK
ncbi:MAG TPA: hypothetical protein ENN22_13755 [bacterium]|nr:hypothetical protein [bacterium]